MSSKVLKHDQIAGSILFIRGHRVMLDSDLAELYGVTTKHLNQQVKRNADRFPDDFMFRLSREEMNRSQIVTGSKHRDPRFLPYAFTEHGAIMLASVLNSKTAVDASIQVVRAFIRLRQTLLAHKKLSSKLDQLERKTEKHDEEIQAIFSAIRQLMKPPEPTRRKIGFHSS